MGEIDNRSLTNNNKMNNRIASSSVFGEYSGKENRVTAAFLHILDLGGEPLLRYVLGVANESLPDNEIRIGTQQVASSGKGKSVFGMDVAFASKKNENTNKRKSDQTNLAVCRSVAYRQSFSTALQLV